jgi:hypothetical protein
MSAAAGLLSPSALDLLQCVAGFLEQDLLPAQTDSKLRFRVRIAADLLKSASRELTGSDQLARDAEGFAVPRAMLERGESLHGLLADLRSDRRSLADEDVYEAALQLVRAKLAIVMGGDRNATS